MKSLLSVMQIQQFNHLHLEQPMYYVQDRILCKLSSQTQTYIELKTDLCTCKNTTSSTLVKLNMWDMYVYCFFIIVNFSLVSVYIHFVQCIKFLIIIMENNANYNIIARARSIYQCQGR